MRYGHEQLKVMAAMDKAGVLSVASADSLLVAATEKVRNIVDPNNRITATADAQQREITQYFDTELLAHFKQQQVDDVQQSQLVQQLQFLKQAALRTVEYNQHLAGLTEAQRSHAYQQQQANLKKLQEEYAMGHSFAGINLQQRARLMEKARTLQVEVQQLEQQITQIEQSQTAATAAQRAGIGRRLASLQQTKGLKQAELANIKRELSQQSETAAVAVAKTGIAGWKVAGAGAAAMGLGKGLLVAAAAVSVAFPPAAMGLAFLAMMSIGVGICVTAMGAKKMASDISSSKQAKKTDNKVSEQEVLATYRQQHPVTFDSEIQQVNYHGHDGRGVAYERALTPEEMVKYQMAYECAKTDDRDEAAFYAALNGMAEKQRKQLLDGVVKHRREQMQAERRTQRRMCDRTRSSHANNNAAAAVTGPHQAPAENAAQPRVAT